MTHKFQRMAATLLLAGASMLSLHAAVPTTGTADDRTNRSIRRELVTMPFLSVFDNLSFRVEGNTVHLYGQVTRPTLKAQAAKLAAQVEGIEHVDNQVEVLPLSPFDDRLRVVVARAVYGQPALNRYAMGTNPPIRIIVKNGDVTLEGVVADNGARNIANIQANGVAGVFSVTNNLRVER